MPTHHANLFHPETRVVIGNIAKLRQVTLSPQEMQTLATLGKGVDHTPVLTGQLALALYGHFEHMPVNAEKTLRVIVLNLRRKMVEAGSAYEIVSDYGKGYHLRKIADSTESEAA
jgi:DNA-binding response OmpR family regulator